MLWLVARYGEVDHKTIVSIACDCAEPALAYVPAGENRPAECIAVVRRWLKDEATIEEVEAAADAARAARAARAAADAAWAAADAADAAWAAAAWAAAARAARAAWAARAARAAARTESLQFSADICRKYIVIDTQQVV